MKIVLIGVSILTLFFVFLAIEYRKNKKEKSQKKPRSTRAAETPRVTNVYRGFDPGRTLFDPSQEELESFAEKHFLASVRTYILLPNDGLIFFCTAVIRAEGGPVALFPGQKEEEAPRWRDRRFLAKQLFKDKLLTPAFTASSHPVLS